jgi:hypothetical protein
MIALAVYLNGKKLTVAGAEDLSVLNAIVTAVGKLGKSTAPLGKGRLPHLHLSVGGLTNRGGGLDDEHLGWIRLQSLSVGDKISVRIVRTDRPNKYKSATPAGGNMQKINERRRKLSEGIKSRSKSKGPRREN